MISLAVMSQRGDGFAGGVRPAVECNGLHVLAVEPLVLGFFSGFKAPSLALVSKLLAVPMEGVAEAGSRVDLKGFVGGGIHDGGLCFLGLFCWRSSLNWGHNTQPLRGFKNYFQLFSSPENVRFFVRSDAVNGKNARANQTGGLLPDICSGADASGEVD